MECSVCSTNGESINWNESYLSVIDGVCGSKERPVEGALNKATACVHPNVLVVTAGINERGKILSGLGVLEVGLIIEVDVGLN
jgi:hypothetical protein